MADTDRSHVVSAHRAYEQGLSPESLRNAADWNGAAAKEADKRRDYRNAARLMSQEDDLRSAAYGLEALLACGVAA